MGVCGGHRGGRGAWLPGCADQFIGRAGSVREVAGLLEEYRLVTVTGPGGSGKTRLADRVAEQVAARFADGAWLAELAAVPDPAQVAAAPCNWHGRPGRSQPTFPAPWPGGAPGS